MTNRVRTMTMMKTVKMTHLTETLITCIVLMAHDRMPQSEDWEISKLGQRIDLTQLMAGGGLRILIRSSMSRNKP